MGDVYVMLRVTHGQKRAPETNMGYWIGHILSKDSWCESSRAERTETSAKIKWKTKQNKNSFWSFL